MTLFLSPWIPLAVMFALAVVARIIQGSWLAPSAFGGLLWFVYGGVSMATNEDRVAPSTVWIIAGLIISLQVGAFLAEEPVNWTKSSRHDRGEKWRVATGSRLLLLSLVLSLVPLLGVLKFIADGLKKFDLSFSLEGFLSLGGLMYGAFLEGAPDPWWFRLLRMWIFPAALLGGLAGALASTLWQKLLALPSLVSALFLGTAIASRYGTGLALICWISGYLSMKAHVSKGRFRIGRSLVLVGTLACGGVIAMYVALSVVRGHTYADVSEGTTSVRSNLLGYLAVFDDWAQRRAPGDMTLGGYTLAGVLELSGAKARTPAMDYEEIQLQSGIWSNIYTAWRGLLQDFSLPGATVLCFIAGVVAGRAYTRVGSGQTSGIGTLAGYYAFLLWSPIVSIFNYNAVLLALLVARLAFRIPNNGQGRSRALGARRLAGA